MFYIFLGKVLRVKAYKMFGHQTNLYVPAFMEILLFQAYSKHIVKLKLEKKLWAHWGWPKKTPYL